MSSTVEASQLSLVSVEEVISLSHAKDYVFSDSVLCLGTVNQNPTSNAGWEEKLSWFKDSPQYRTLDTIDGEPMVTTLQLISKVQEFMTKMGDPSQFKGRMIVMSMFKNIIWGSEERHACVYICKKIPSRTLVIPRTWIRKEVVFYLH